MFHISHRPPDLTKTLALLICSLGIIILISGCDVVERFGGIGPGKAETGCKIFVDIPVVGSVHLPLAGGGGTVEDVKVGVEIVATRSECMFERKETKFQTVTNSSGVFT